MEELLSEADIMERIGFIRHKSECVIQKYQPQRSWYKLYAIGSSYSFCSCSSAELQSALLDISNISRLFDDS
jgi:hypothetical protein